MTLYVCNFGAGTVTVYPKGSLSPSKPLTQAGVSPLDVVVGKDGTVYVADFNEGYDGVDRTPSVNVQRDAGSRDTSSPLAA